MLVEAAPGTFFSTAHYKDGSDGSGATEKLDLEWARANLVRVWRAQAPEARAEGVRRRIAATSASPIQAPTDRPMTA